MPTQPNKPFEDEILDVKKQSLYARLKRLFSTDVIVRNVGGKQLKIKDTDSVMYATDKNSLRDRFNRIRSTAYNAYSRDFALSYQAARMDLFRDYDCVGPDTIIPLPDGTRPTIKELAEKYKDKPQERFHVFSYDHETDSIKLGEAYHPRKKEGGTRMGYKVTFDNDQFVIGSIKHPFLMRNGEYKIIADLKIGESVMPFYQKLFYPKKHYRFLYNFSKGWQAEHKIIAEQFYRLLLENDVVHHKNFITSDNTYTNLEIMDSFAHKSYHAKLKDNVSGENNPFYGRKHTPESNQKRSNTLKEVFKNRNQSGNRNPKFREDLTIEVMKSRAMDYYKNNGKLTSWEFVKDIGCDYSVLQNRLKDSNTNWNIFKKEIISTLNHKIKSIESIGEIDVYDVTVEHFENFATDSCFIHNTMDMDPILSCLSADTCISTLTGFVNIKELTEKYPNGESFKVWSWDKDKQKLTLGNAHHPRKTGTKAVIELHLNNNTILKCTPDHRIMLIDGTYKEAGTLLSGESLMPFYHSVDNTHGYGMIKSLGKSYKNIHRYIFEDVFEQNVGSDNIHHINHNKLDNRIENLQRMPALEHCKLHGIHPITTDKRSESSKELWKDENYRTRALSGWKTWRESEEGKRMMSENTSFMNKKRWKNDIGYVTKMKSIFSTHALEMWKDPEWKEWKRKHHSETMKLKYANDPVFREQTRRPGKSNGRYKNIITTESILIEGSKYNSLSELANGFDFKGVKFKSHQDKCQFIRRRLNSSEYKTWDNYKSKFVYNNHKVKKIVNNNEITDVYDLTVDIYENFALESGVIVSNSACDVFADECLTYNEMGKMLTIHSDNNNVKEILENLYNDILNVQFNMWSWTRNLVKYGDFFLKLYITPEYGVYMVEPISAYNVERIENADPYNKRYVKFQLRPTDTAQAEVLENYEMAHFRLMSDSNFLPYGKCVAANTSISTTGGPKQIKDIEIGDVAYSFDFNEKKVVSGKILNKVMSGIKTVYEIKTAHRKIYATDEHPFMVHDGRYKQVRDLTIKDYLILPTINCETNIHYPKLIVEETDDWKYHSNLVKIDADIIEKNFREFVRFYGFLLGDGWLDKSNQTVAFSLGSRLDKSRKYLDFVKKLGLNYRLTNEFMSDSSVIINSVYLYKLLEQLEFKTGSTNKSIPPWVWILPKEYKQEILFGFSDADGCDIDDNTSQLGSINEKLIHNLRIIAMECGLSTTKIWDTMGSGYNDNCKMFLFTYKLKSRDFLETDDEHHIEKIRSITECDKVEVYDIQIDNNLHNFIADGVVIHNSMIEGGRRVWKQLSLMEDAMLIHRIMRAPEKRIFYTDIGNIPPAEVDNYMQKMMDKMKKVPYMDEQSGEYNLRFNLQNMVEDYYIPVRGGDSGTKIDTLGGMEWTGTDDVEYLRNKLMAALKIPKPFLGYDESTCVVPETQVPLLNGFTKTIKELIEDHSNKIKNYVYSIDEETKNIVTGEIEWAGYTRMDTDVIRVHLDNGNYIDCTPDHRFMAGDGKWIESKDLTEGQSLMPLYGKIYHKAVKIEVLSEKRDTCDITIKKYHNFATSAGVVIHNSGKSTLASEDVRFARTIQRIQKILINELEKIGIVHLYAQGYRDDTLVDFKLELTNPSTIFEKEKLEIFADKVAVATDMVENKFFSYDWIYKNIFNMSDDDIKIVKDEVVEDAKQRYRFASIEEDGDDPAKPFNKIGGGGKGGGDGGGGGGGLGGGGGGGGGGGSMPDLGDLEGGPEGEAGKEGVGNEGGTEGELPGAEGVDGEEDPENPKKKGKPGEDDTADLVKENTSKPVVDNRDRSDRKQVRDQTGEGDARRDHPRTEDPLGEDGMNPKVKKNSEGKRASDIAHNFEGGTPLRLREQKMKAEVKKVDSALFTSLAEFMNKTHTDPTAELLAESKAIGGKSLLDEKNILSE